MRREAVQDERNRGSGGGGGGANNSGGGGQVYELNLPSRKNYSMFLFIVRIS